MAMWLSPERGAVRGLTVESRQSVWPATDDSDAELIVTTRADLVEEVALATPQLLRLVFRVEHMEGALTLGDSPATLWADAARVEGASFEITVTQRGAVLAPFSDFKLPKRVLSWLQSVAEEVRAALPYLPDDVEQGSSWSTPQVAPGGLPPGATSVKLGVRYTAVQLQPTRAKIAIDYDLSARLAPGPLRAEAAQGEGRVLVQLDRSAGIASAERQSRLLLQRREARPQLVRVVATLQQADTMAQVAGAGATAPRPLPKVLDDEATPEE